MLALNEALLDLVNGLAGRSSLLDAAGRFAAQDLLYLLAALCAGLCAWQLYRDRRDGLRLAAATALGCGAALVLSMALGNLLFEARPFVHDADTVRLIPHAADASFPSDHATLAGGLATVGALAWRQAGALLGGLAALVALARVFVGVHYPGDVAVGLALGSGCAVLAWVAVHRAEPILSERYGRLRAGRRAA